MVQPIAKAVIDYVEGYWDAPLTLSLVERIIRWDDNELDRFYAGWPMNTSERATQWFDLPQLERGQIRPILGALTSPTTELELAPLLLLYVESVLVDAMPISPTWTFSARRRHPMRDRYDILVYLGWLAAMRSLVLDGSVLFANKVVSLEPESLAPVFGAILDSKKSHWKGTRFEGLSRKQRLEQSHWVVTDFAANIHEARRGHGTALALDFVEERLYELTIGQRANSSQRPARLAQLGAWNVPLFRADASDLAAVRSADRFVEWRSTLTRALDDVAGLPASSNAGDARGLLASELAASFSNVKREAARSPALRAMTSGWKGLAFGGVVGAVEGSITGTAWGGAVAAGAAITSNAVSEYLQAKHVHAENNAVWDVVMSFREWSERDHPADYPFARWG